MKRFVYFALREESWKELPLERRQKAEEQTWRNLKGALYELERNRKEKYHV